MTSSGLRNEAIPSSVSVPFQFQDPETHLAAERAACIIHYNSRRTLSSTAYTGLCTHHERAPENQQRHGAEGREGKNGGGEK
jgi:hypothetical protein